MYIKSLTLHNWMPFKDTQTLNLEGEDVLFVKGTYERNPDESNQAGKTSVISAVGYLLYGETPKGLKEIDLIHHNQDEMYVEGEVIFPDKEIKIKRGRTKENKAILEIEGVEGKKKDKQNELVELIGMDSHSFFQTRFVRQGEIDGFMNLGPTDRKKLLQQWLNLDRWKEYEDKAKSKRDEMQKQVASIEAEIVAFKKQIQETNTQAEEVSLQLELSAKEKQLKESEDRLVQLKVELSNIESHDINNLQSELKDLEKKWKEMQECQKRFDSIPEIQSPKLSETLGNESKAIESKMLQLNEQCSAWKQELSGKKQLLSSVCTFTGMCPVDQKPCDKGTRIPDYKNELDAICGELEGKIKVNSSQLTNTWKELEEKRKSANIALSQESEKESLRHWLTFKGDTEKSLNNLRQQIAKIDVSKVASLRSTISQEEKQQESLSQRINTINKELGRLAQVQKQQEEYKEKVKVKEAELREINKSLYRWKYLCYMFGKDGIPSILIENNLDFIEDFANLILDKLNSDMTIEFTTQREVSTKETHCSVCGSIFDPKEAKCLTCGYGFKGKKLRDEIDIKILTNNQESKFEQASGGGKVLISLAVRLALSKLLSNNKKPCHMLVLDEVFGSLDSVNRYSTSTLVFNMLKDLMGTKQILVISHCDLNDFAYKAIKVTRFSDFSKISLDK